MARVLRLLTCYNPNTPVAIGERYGFQLWDSDYGYEYLTGGAGVALSASLVHEIIELGKCECPSSTTPDDMYLFGICLSRIRVQPVHSSMFHQVCYTKLFTLFKINVISLKTIIYIYYRHVLQIMRLHTLLHKNPYHSINFG